MKRHKAAFTLIELLVVISIIALLIAILLPALSAARKGAIQLQSSTQLRGIHQGMVVFAQDNKQWFPGWDPGGGQWLSIGSNASHNLNGVSVQSRFAELLSGDFVTGEYLISPAEPYTREAYHYADWDGTSATKFDQINYSFAMQELSQTSPGTGIGNRPAVHSEWNVDSMNSESVVLGDRLLSVASFGDVSTYIGIYSNRPGELKFGVAWNDGHITFENNPSVAKTSYGRFTNADDNIYMRGSQGYTVDLTPPIQTTPTPALANDGYVDAMLVYRGNGFLLSNLPGE